MLNSRDVSLLRPDVAANCRTWLERCRAAGLNVLVTNTVRDREYQEYLYQQGRTRPGGIVTNGRVPTFHSDRAGLAWDFCKNVKGSEYSDPDFFRRAAALAKEMGFSWGGDWRSFPDSPHIQWDSRGQWTGSMILAGKLPPVMPPYEKEEIDMSKDELKALIRETVEEVLAKENPIYHDLKDVPAYWQDYAEALLNTGAVNGGTPEEVCATDLNLRRETLKAVVVAAMYHDAREGGR